MTPDSNRSTKIAGIVIKLTNPSILSVILLLLIAFAKPETLRESLGWISLIFITYMVIPVIYLYTRTKLNLKQLKSIVELTIFLKTHPIDILILALCLGIPCLFILLAFHAPTILTTTVIALVAGSIVTSLFNLFYRVSYHLTGLTVLVIMAAQAWGPAYLMLGVTIPLVFWAKYHNREHTIPQLVIGLVVSVIISLAAIRLFR
jgi:hypothetical protein